MEEEEVVLVLDKKKKKRDSEGEKKICFSEVNIEHEEGHIDLPELIPEIDPEDETLQDLDRRLGQTQGEYRYEDLLRRANLQLGRTGDLKKEKQHLPTLMVGREGTKKTVLVNLGKISECIGRDNDHILDYFKIELRTEGSINESLSMILKGKFSVGDLEGIMRRYVDKFVLCRMCHSLESHFEREARLDILVCDKCGAHRSVQMSKAGYDPLKKE